jgi:hypothetical protein
MSTRVLLRAFQRHLAGPYHDFGMENYWKLNITPDSHLGTVPGPGVEVQTRRRGPDEICI